MFSLSPSIGFTQSACCTQPGEYHFYVDAGGAGVSMEYENIPSNANNIYIFVTNGYLFNSGAIDFDNVTFIFSNTGYLRLYSHADFNGCCFQGQNNNFWQGLYMNGSVTAPQYINFTNCCFENAGNALFQDSWYELGLKVNNCTFVNCIKGAVIRNLDFKQSVIYNSDFTINNSQYIRTGGSFAISADRSSVSMYNCGISGYATGVSANNFSSIRILSCNIEECNIGINLKLASTIYLKVSDITGVGSQSTGILSMDSYINGSDNTIVNCNQGVSINGQSGLYALNAFNLWDNQIGTETSPYGQVGISVYNFGNIVYGFSKIHYNNIGFSSPNSNGTAAINVVDPNPLNSIEIFENQIRGKNHGVLLSGVHSAYVAFNSINSNPSGNSAYGNWSGIRLENSTNSLIFGNEITSNSNYHGINIFQGSNNNFCCNYTNCPVGVTFDGMSSADLKGTVIDKISNNEGLILSESAIIGRQRYNNNNWKTSLSSNGGTCLNLANYDQSIFIVQESQTPLHPININIQDWFSVVSDSYDVCPEYGFDICGIDWEPNKAKRFKSLDSFVVVENFNGDFGTDQSDQHRLVLFENYFMDSTEFIENDFFLEYIHENIESDYYKVAEFKHQLSSLYTSSEESLELQQKLIETFIYTDSLSNLWENDPDEVDNVFDSTNMEFIAATAEDLISLKDTNTAYMANGLEDLLELLDSYEFENEWADTIRAYYQIHLGILLRDSLYLTTYEQDRLTSLAQLCPMKYGSAVFMAVTMLKAFEIEIIPDNENCNISPPLKKVSGKQTGKLNSIHALYRAEEAAHQIEVYNLAGSLLYKGLANIDKINQLKNIYNNGLLFIRNLSSDQKVSFIKY